MQFCISKHTFVFMLFCILLTIRGTSGVVSWWACVLFCSLALHSFCLFTSCVAELWYTQIWIWAGFPKQHLGCNSCSCFLFLFLCKTLESLVACGKQVSDSVSPAVTSTRELCDVMCSLSNAGMMTPAAARPNGRGSGLVPGVGVSGQNITLHNWQPEQPRAVWLPNHNLTAWEWQCSKMLNQAVIQGPSLFV